MSTTNPNRNPAGTPTGGQFATKPHPESGVELGVESQSVRTVFPDGTEEWRQNGQLHRDDGPAVTKSDGIEEWYQNGKLHRVDGPAVVRPDGTEMWYQNGQLHRDGGPAVTWPDGTEEWFQNGQLHRDDGPAITWPDGTEEWYQNGNMIDPPDPSSARLSDDAIRSIINDKSLLLDERVAKLRKALGDPVESEVDEPPGIDYSATAFRRHFEGDVDIEPLLDGLTDDQIHVAADNYLCSAESDHIWEAYHVAGCDIIRQAATDAGGTG